VCRQHAAEEGRRLRSRVTAALGEIAGMVTLAADVVAERTGRSSDEFELRVLAGALMGVVFGLMLTEPDTSPRDLIALVGAGLEQLEKGIDL
jgi:hypothetical protein